VSRRWTLCVWRCDSPVLRGGRVEILPLVLFSSVLFFSGLSESVFNRGLVLSSFAVGRAGRDGPTLGTRMCPLCISFCCGIHASGFSGAPGFLKFGPHPYRGIPFLFGFPLPFSGLPIPGRGGSTVPFKFSSLPSLRDIVSH